MKVKSKTFNDIALVRHEKALENACNEAAEFASNIGKDRLINITTTGNISGQFFVTVWYWE